MTPTWHAKSMRFETNLENPGQLADLLLPWILWKKGYLVLKDGVSAMDILQAPVEMSEIPAPRPHEVLEDFDDFILEEEPSVSMDELQTLCKDVSRRLGSRKPVISMIQQYGTDSISDVPRENWAALHAQLQEAMSA